MGSKHNSRVFFEDVRYALTSSLLGGLLTIAIFLAPSLSSGEVSSGEVQTISFIPQGLSQASPALANSIYLPIVMVPETSITLSPTVLTPFDVDLHDLLAPPKWYFGKTPEIIVASHGNALDIFGPGLQF